MRRRQCLLAGAALAAVPVAALAQVQPAEPAEVVELPAIHLLDGGTLEAGSWRGRAGVLVFWATHCAYCQRHNAHIDKLYRASVGQPLRVLGIALDDDADAVRRYMATHGYRFPVALDGGVLRPRLTARRVIPMTCLLDPQGRLLQAIPGEMTESDVLGLARQLLRPAG